MQVIVLDGGIGFLDTALERAETEGYTQLDISPVLGVDEIFPAQDVALGRAGLVVHVLVERSAGQQAHSEAVFTQEGALQRERIAIPRLTVGVNILAAVPDLSKDVSRQL